MFSKIVKSLTQKSPRRVGPSPEQIAAAQAASPRQIGFSMNGSEYLRACNPNDFGADARKHIAALEAEGAEVHTVYTNDGRMMPR